VAGWKVVPAILGGHEVLAVFNNPSDPQPAYFVQLTFSNERVATIRDFRYVPYIAREANIELISQPESTTRKETYEGA
jgi:RNA polymerase sigma-70 factor (ECF subfamily)